MSSISDSLRRRRGAQVEDFGGEANGGAMVEPWWGHGGAMVEPWLHWESSNQSRDTCHGEPFW